MITHKVRAALATLQLAGVVSTLGETSHMHIFHFLPRVGQTLFVRCTLDSTSYVPVRIDASRRPVSGSLYVSSYNNTR